jgi:hypothetical protein
VRVRVCVRVSVCPCEFKCVSVSVGLCVPFCLCASKYMYRGLEARCPLPPRALFRSLSLPPSISPYVRVPCLALKLSLSVCLSRSLPPPLLPFVCLCTFTLKLGALPSS